MGVCKSAKQSGLNPDDYGFDSHLPHHMGVQTVMEAASKTARAGSTPATHAKFMELLFSVTMKDLEMQTFSVGGHGGSGKDTSNSGVRLTHRASGAVGEGREHRSNTQNRISAFKKLVASKKFRDWHRIECARRLGRSIDEEKVRRQAAFGEGRVRTYHFPDQRVVDERLEKQYPLGPIMDGRLEKLISDLVRVGS